MKTTKKLWRLSGVMLLLFAALTLVVKFVNVAPIGPQNSKVGLSAVNGAIRDFFGVNMQLYNVTEIMGYMSVAVAAFFAFSGLYQLVKYKSIGKVDSDIILLGAFYVVVVIVYALFEVVVINYRPVLTDGVLEASYPSSHTMLVVCIMGSTIYQAVVKIKAGFIRNGVVAVCSAIAAITVLGRMACGVHWFTDIMAGLLLSLGLVFAYIALCRSTGNNRHLRYTGK